MDQNSYLARPHNSILVIMQTLKKLLFSRVKMWTLLDSCAICKQSKNTCGLQYMMTICYIIPSWRRLDFVRTNACHTSSFHGSCSTCNVISIQKISSALSETLDAQHYAKSISFTSIKWRILWGTKITWSSYKVSKSILKFKNSKLKKISKALGSSSRLLKQVKSSTMNKDLHKMLK